MALVRLKKASPSIILPSYETEGAAGADIRAFLPEKPMVLQPGTYSMIPTGLFPEIPVGYEIQVRPRSGLAAKFGVTVLNTPGTIDSDYRGEIKVILINHSDKEFTVKDGDRIAQLVVSPVVQATFQEAATIDETKRGVGGFGSTGI